VHRIIVLLLVFNPVRQQLLDQFVSAAACAAVICS